MNAMTTVASPDGGLAVRAGGRRWSCWLLGSCWLRWYWRRRGGSS